MYKGACGREDSIVANEMMFYTYGGAVLRIHGTAHNVKKMANGHLTFDADVRITIEDDYDFKENDGGLRTLYSTSYSAANFLQTDPNLKYQKFKHTGSYDVHLKDVEWRHSPQVSPPGGGDGGLPIILNP